MAADPRREAAADAIREAQNAEIAKAMTPDGTTSTVYTVDPERTADAVLAALDAVEVRPRLEDDEAVTSQTSRET